MSDPRSKRLADLIVQHSLELSSGEAVLIEATDVGEGLVLDLIDSVHAAGALPLVSIRSNAVIRAQLNVATEALVQRIAAIELAQMQEVQAYIGIRGTPNVSELADVPGDRMDLYLKHVVKPVHLEYRVEKTRWVVLRYPNPSMAQLAGMSTRAFEDFFYQVCTLDYHRMAEAMEPLKQRMERTDQVRIKGPGHRPAFQHSRNPRGQVRRPAESAGWRVLHGAGARLRPRHHHLQHAFALHGNHLRRRPLHVRRRPHRRCAGNAPGTPRGDSEQRRWRPLRR
jgi:aminopeptidase